MLNNLRLTRPLAILDVETTGLNQQTDRIVEISVLKIQPDGTHVQRTRRLNPGRPISADATAVHGITDADVANQPSFDQTAKIASGIPRRLLTVRLQPEELRREDALGGVPAGKTDV